MNQRRHHSHNQYDKMRLNVGTRALVKLARMTIPAALATAYTFGVYTIFNSYASANERRARAENSSSMDKSGRTR